MITKITMQDVASYKNPVALETDKKINLIYGLNGSGKTVLSSFLYDPHISDYSKCTISGISNEKILVYNEKFIQDNFYEAENLKGIFTLSKGNKIAEEAAQKERTQIKALEDQIITLRADKNANEARQQKLQTDTENVIWQIKTAFAGGDRVMEFCLENLKRKELLLKHISSVPRPKEQPQTTIDMLKKEVELLSSQGDAEMDELELIDFDGDAIEKADHWQKILVGNENSAIHGLIEHLNNSDWVKKGLEYIDPPSDSSSSVCPFCQQNTITLDLLSDIRNYFDENYQKNLDSIVELQNEYVGLAESLPSLKNLQLNVFAIEKKVEIETALDALRGRIEQNKLLMQEKIQQPSKIISLIPTTSAVEQLNDIIKKINDLVKIQNDKVKRKGDTLREIKNLFWQIMRFDYDQTISKYFSDTAETNRIDQDFELKINDTLQKIHKHSEELARHQKMTINIDEAINNINSGLIELGIDGFSIVKHQDVFYRISRNGKLDQTFKTLSEGEKMIISFLYFRELCEGRSDAQDTSTKKIVVIDDPISSLSHIYVFNVGRLIKNTFLNTDDYEQIFILTHSLYFFYEVIETKPDKRKLSHKLFRLSKNTQGSFITELKYEEIQSDYQAYWYIIRDTNQPAALIANSMRNILEYFFNFIEKKDLNNLFQKPELSSVRYQAFNRFINRESHSLGQNIFDYKEFNYDDFRSAFEAVFIAAGYPEHFNKMMKK